MKNKAKEPEERGPEELKAEELEKAQGAHINPIPNFRGINPVPDEIDPNPDAIDPIPN